MEREELTKVFDHLRALAKRTRTAALAGDLATMRAAVEEYGAVSDETLEVTAEVRAASADGVPCEWIRHDDSDPDRRLLYIHGGGWVCGTLPSYRPIASRLSEAAGCAVLTVDYRLAPEHPFPAGLDDCMTTYAWMLENGPEGPGAVSHAFMAGDSAGGNLTLASLLKLRDEGGRLPDGAIVISPATDFTASGESCKTRLEVDPIIDASKVPASGRQYFPGRDAREPYLSPLFGDLEGLPPLLIQVGDAETLLSDSTRFAEKAETAGVDVTLEVWPEMPHVWHFFAPVLPESQQAINKIGAFIKSR